MIGARVLRTLKVVRVPWVPVLLLLLGCQSPAPVVGGDGGCVEGAPVLPGALVNARDLGGLPTAGGPLSCGRIFRAAAPTSLSDEGCSAFAALGLKTVIDLRTQGERFSAPNAACVDAAATTVTAPMPVPYNVSPVDYLADLHTDASVKALFDTLGDEAKYPVLIHCTYGRDRSGVAAALVLLALGASREVILRDYLRTADNGLSAFPASLEAVLDEVEREGGIDAFLAGSGVAPETVAVLRGR